MTDLKDFRERLAQLRECKKMPRQAKAAAADIVANKIEKCLWEPWAKGEAEKLSLEFMEYSRSLGGWTMEGHDWLGWNGQLG